MGERDGYLLMDVTSVTLHQCTPSVSSLIVLRSSSQLCEPLRDYDGTSLLRVTAENLAYLGIDDKEEVVSGTGLGAPHTPFRNIVLTDSPYTQRVNRRVFWTTFTLCRFC